MVPGLDDLVTEVVHGGVWGRPNSGLADRAICTLAVLSGGCHVKSGGRPPRSHLANVVDAMPDPTPSLERPTGFSSLLLQTAASPSARPKAISELNPRPGRDRS